jgi:cytochrome bd ubiquinol oxidase subunit II
MRAALDRAHHERLKHMDSRAAIAIALLWGLLTVYALLGALDFGAGFYRWLAWLRGRDEARTVAHDFLKPVWEVVNVFLVLLVVGMVGFFPMTADIFGTALLVPFSLAIIVLAVRGAAIGFSHLAPRPTMVYEAAIGISGLLAPALLVSFVASSESGAISMDAAGGVHVSQALLWFSPLYLALALLAGTATTHLSALILYRRAMRLASGSAAAFYRRGAVHSGLVSGALALVLLLALRLTVPEHFAALMTLWPLLLLVAAGWALEIWALARSTGLGGRLVALMAGLSTWGLAIVTFGAARLPWLLYGEVRLDEALTPPAMFTGLLVTVASGLVVLLPSLALLYIVLLRPATPASDADAVQAEVQRTKDRTLVAAGSH